MEARAAGAATDTSFVTSKPVANNGTATTAAATTTPGSSTSAATRTDLQYTKKPSKLQNAIYLFLVFLSVCSLLYLVFISMQSVTLTPVELLNGTWHVVADRSGAAALKNQLPKQAIEEEEEKSKPAQYDIQRVEDELVVIDLSAYVNYEDRGPTESTQTLPPQVLPLDVAPRFVEPLHLDFFAKGWSGGAKTLKWNGPCTLKRKAKADDESPSSPPSASSLAAICFFTSHRGHYLLTVFGLDGASNKAPALSIVGTRVDTDPLLETAAFDRKVKYVMLIMLCVAVIHHALSSFAPPTQAQMKRDAARGRLMELQRQRLAATTAAAPQNK